MWPPRSTGRKLGSTSKKPEKPKRLFQDLNVRPYIHAVVALSAIFLSLYVYQGVSQPMETLNPEDGDRLKQVFFGNETWLVLCQNDPTKPLYPAFEGAARKMSPSALSRWLGRLWGGEAAVDKVNFGVLDCKAKLPSGRTTIQRLKLNRNIEPVIFLTTPGSGKPRQLLPRYMSTQEALVKELKSVTTPQAAVVRDTQGLKDHCLSGEQCLLVLRGKAGFGKAEEKALTSMMRAYGASVKFAIVDSILHEVSIEKTLPRFDPTVTRVVMFNNHTAADTVSSRRKKASPSPLKAKAFYGDLTRKELGEFLDEALAGKLRYKKVGEVTVSRRSGRPKPGSEEEATRIEQEKLLQDLLKKRASDPLSDSGDSGSSEPRSKEEEARLQAAREAAIREAMEKERESFIQYDDGQEGNDDDGASDAAEEDGDILDVDDVIDIDEEV